MDYVSLSVTSSFSAFSPDGTRWCTTFNVIDDSENESREFFKLWLVNLSPEVVTVLEGENKLRVYILDDDSELYICTAVIFSITMCPLNMLHRCRINLLSLGVMFAKRQPRTLDIF